MNLLLVGADRFNSTDGVIVKGVLTLLKEAYGDFTYIYKYLDDYVSMTELDFYPDVKFDAVVVCGTPWLWDSFQNSEKYRNIVSCFHAHSKAKKIFLGAGTCLNLDAANDVLERPEEISAIRFLYKDATIITRERIACFKLRAAGITNTFLPCPAYFCYGPISPINSNKVNPVLVYIDPLKSISNEYWSRVSKVDHFNETILSFVAQFQPIVVCASNNDVEGANKLGLDPIVLNTPEDTLKIMETATVALSARVHCAVPAIVQGARVGIFPLDTRATVLTDFGVPPVTSKLDFERMSAREIDLELFKNKYVEILRGVL